MGNALDAEQTMVAARVLCRRCRDEGLPEPVAGRVLYDRMGGTVSGGFVHKDGKDALSGQQAYIRCSANRTWEASAGHV